MRNTNHSRVSHKQNELNLMHSDICSVLTKTYKGVLCISFVLCEAVLRAKGKNNMNSKKDKKENDENFELTIDKITRVPQRLVLNMNGQIMKMLNSCMVVT